MATIIDDEGTERLIRRYAELKGLDGSGAVRIAITAALDRENALPEGESFLDRVRVVQDLVASYPLLDARSAEEIIGYDEDGLPN
jgi:antitoxin VapB